MGQIEPPGPQWRALAPLGPSAPQRPDPSCLKKPAARWAASVRVRRDCEDKRGANDVCLGGWALGCQRIRSIRAFQRSPALNPASDCIAWPTESACKTLLWHATHGMGARAYRPRGKRGGAARAGPRLEELPHVRAGRGLVATPVGVPTTPHEAAGRLAHPPPQAALGGPIGRHADAGHRAGRPRGAVRGATATLRIPKRRRMHGRPKLGEPTPLELLSMTHGPRRKARSPGSRLGVLRSGAGRARPGPAGSRPQHLLRVRRRPPACKNYPRSQAHLPLEHAMRRAVLRRLVSRGSAERRPSGRPPKTD